MLLMKKMVRLNGVNLSLSLSLSGRLANYRILASGGVGGAQLEGGGLGLGLGFRRRALEGLKGFETFLRWKKVRNTIREKKKRKKKKEAA